ncbi:type II toxin-antitoxin system HicB family antitoxin [Variovorax ginsengisoli]|uniref:Type II toxin-antitoxin system HicB family antitoxin n=1 Tax=Variovorax ginsengisoli TaxID=363844 RepID=A0ABT8SGN4_9BURK|nr:type II toxin-antitoxin system HicB family antitoxin [Variovorax ginsengisoli]MDN8617972.1 type II toxin-antitoxin system HicB family antitoxin [Variovorax ginsengisoli]MDO1537142.1 type II toxin-antitoxin system HicB family antitoxin [Variovorax ginsengisoli]
MFSYPAKIARDGDGYVVSFPDIPEALTGAKSRSKALDLAADALTTAMDFYFEDRRPVPYPSPLKRGQVAVDLPASVSAKVLLLNEMIAQGTRPADLARRMAARPQEVTRLMDLHHPTKIDTVAAALRALGKRLELCVV